MDVAAMHSPEKAVDLNTSPTGKDAVGENADDESEQRKR